VSGNPLKTLGDCVVGNTKYWAEAGKGEQPANKRAFIDMRETDGQGRRGNFQPNFAGNLNCDLGWFCFPSRVG